MMNKDEILAQEAKLTFESFNNDMALALVEIINEDVKQHYLKKVGIRIVHNGLVVLHFLMNDRKESPWLQRKVKTVIASSHSSLYVYAERDQNPTYHDWIEDSTQAVCGGGFPIIENGKITGAICVSGLDHLDDHEVVVNALQTVLQKITE